MTYYHQVQRMIGLWLTVYVSQERESKLEGRAFVFVDCIQSIEPLLHTGQCRVVMRNGATIHALHSPDYIVDLFKEAASP